MDCRAWVASGPRPQGLIRLTVTRARTLQKKYNSFWDGDLSRIHLYGLFPSKVLSISEYNLLFLCFWCSRYQSYFRYLTTQILTYMTKTRSCVATAMARGVAKSRTQRMSYCASSAQLGLVLSRLVLLCHVSLLIFLSCTYFSSLHNECNTSLFPSMSVTPVWYFFMLVRIYNHNTTNTKQYSLLQFSGFVFGKRMGNLFVAESLHAPSALRNQGNPTEHCSQSGIDRSKQSTKHNGEKGW